MSFNLTNDPSGNPRVASINASIVGVSTSFTLAIQFSAYKPYRCAGLPWYHRDMKTSRGTLGSVSVVGRNPSSTTGRCVG
eukprot:30950-Pelagococcus_subviridis.AAC.3